MSVCQEASSGFGRNEGTLASFRELWLNDPLLEFGAAACPCLELDDTRVFALGPWCELSLEQSSKPRVVSRHDQLVLLADMSAEVCEAISGGASGAGSRSRASRPPRGT